MTPAPAYWSLMCTRLLHTTPRLAQELWRAYCAARPYTAVTTRFQLDRMLDAPTIPAVLQRLTHLEAVLPPRELLTATARLSPPGPRRRQEVIAVEEAILHYTTASGQWK